MLYEQLNESGWRHLSIAKKPVFIITPDRRQLTGAGASECAGGSHIRPNGKRLAFVPKPNMKSNPARKAALPLILVL